MAATMVFIDGGYLDKVLEHEHPGKKIDYAALDIGERFEVRTTSARPNSARAGPLRGSRSCPLGSTVSPTLESSPWRTVSMCFTRSAKSP